MVGRPTIVAVIHDGFDLWPIQHLALQETFGQQVQLIDVALQQVLGALVILHHEAIDLSIDRLGGQLAVITVLRNLPA